MYDLISTSLNDLLLCAMELPLPEELPLPVSEEPLPPVPVQKSRRSGSSGKNCPSTWRGSGRSKTSGKQNWTNIPISSGKSVKPGSKGRKPGKTGWPVRRIALERGEIRSCELCYQIWAHLVDALGLEYVSPRWPAWQWVCMRTFSQQGDEHWKKLHQPEFFKKYAHEVVPESVDLEASY